MRKGYKRRRQLAINQPQQKRRFGALSYEAMRALIANAVGGTNKETPFVRRRVPSRKFQRSEALVIELKAQAEAKRLRKAKRRAHHVYLAAITSYKSELNEIYRLRDETQRLHA